MKNLKSIVIFVVVAVLAPLAASAAERGPFSGAVYAMSNDPDGNSIVMFSRGARGHIKPTGVYATGGLGSGGGIDPLGSQNSLIISGNRHWLFAANAGSNDISVFRIRPNDLELAGYHNAGGTFPVSLTLRYNLLYVLNSGHDDEGPNITGFKLDRRGELTPIPDSTRELAPGGYHQVGFNPRGDALVVTRGEPTGVNEILVFPVDEEGLPAETPTITPSAGVVPFGFIFDWRGHLLVSEAGSGAVSSYELGDDYTLGVIDASVSNGNAATCWIAGTWYGEVITANTGSDNLSTYKARLGDGTVRIQNAEAATGDKPIDIATTPDGRFLYALNAGNGTVSAFRISFTGKLRNIGTVAGLPPQFTQGIAAR